MKRYHVFDGKLYPSAEGEEGPWCRSEEAMAEIERLRASLQSQIEATAEEGRRRNGIEERLRKNCFAEIESLRSGLAIVDKLPPAMQDVLLRNGGATYRRDTLQNGRTVVVATDTPVHLLRRMLEEWQGYMTRAEAYPEEAAEAAGGKP